MDVLTDILERSSVRGAAFACSTLHGGTGMRFPSEDALAVKVLVEGETNLWSDDQDAEAGPVTLLPGDVVLLQGTAEHWVAPGISDPCALLQDVLAAGPVPGHQRQYVVGDRSQAADASLVCGAYRVGNDLSRDLFGALPTVLRLRPTPGSTLRAVLDLLAREVHGDGPGQQTTLDRLLDVALVHILREYLLTQSSRAPRWFVAAADPRVGPALRAMHADPSHPWTVGELAAEAALSRAAFARHFTDLLGESPLAYLTTWRMNLAREQLRASDHSIDTVARSVGYRSQYSFAAAFKRHHGIAPGQWRHHAHAR